MRTDHLILRVGTVADAEEVEAIHWAGLEGAYRGRVPGWPEEPRVIADRVSRWRSWLEHPLIDTVVAQAHGRLVGFATLRPCGEPDLDPATHAEMPTLYVHPNYWRLGYGRRLSVETLRRARERGFSSVVLWVIDVNDRARSFYENFGFTFDGTSRPVEESRAPLTAHRYSIEICAVDI